MEWWQIFGIAFIVFAGLFFYSSLAKDAAKKQKQEALALMKDPYEDGQWQHPEELATGASSGDLQSQRDEEDEDDENESFLTKAPKTFNRVINQKLMKLGLKEKVEIGKLQVEHITNANEYADQYFDLRNKSKKNKAKELKLEKKILKREGDLKDVEEMDSLRELRKKNKKLGYDISIAKKEAELNQVKNPPSPPPRELTKTEKREQKLQEINERIMDVIEKIAKIEKFSVLSEEDKQRQLNQLRNKLFDLEQQQNDLL